MFANPTLFTSRKSAERAANEVQGARHFAEYKVTPATRRDTDTREMLTGFVVTLIGYSGQPVDCL